MSTAAMNEQISEQDVWRALGEVMDPELPVVSVVEMGIVREVAVNGPGVTVRITPTFSGCPALQVMRSEIEARLRALGGAPVTVETVLSPPWSSNWISEPARAKLMALGIAPPARTDGSDEGAAGNVTFYAPVPCPRCDSPDTSLKNAFGPTLCKAIYLCNACREPFEAFKPL